MRKGLLFAFCLSFALGAMAQKIETKWHCSKPSSNPSFDVGDVAGHAYALGQGTCEATSSNSGEKSGAYTEFDEIWKASYTGHGRFNVTADNGDKLYYTYETSAPADIKKPAGNKWKIVGGTGKHKGIKGAGTCSGVRNDDGSSDWTCTGTSSMGT
jgi:hypothetical protein